MNWSFSSLMDFEECKHRFKLKKIDRLPELPKAADNPMERGNRVHRDLELYVRGDIDSLADCEAKRINEFMPALDHMRELYSRGLAHCEDDWLFDRDWMDTDRDGAWLWSKLDFGVSDYANSTFIIGDYKTGKSGYSALKHMQQLQLYAAIGALKNPWADRIIAELWYVDEGWVKDVEFTNEQALKLVNRFDVRAQRIFDEKLFKPNPSKPICKYCPYGPSNGTGACPVGV